MSRDTDKIQDKNSEQEEKIVEIVESKNKKVKKEKSKSVQNKVIDNIKNFITKIIEIQEKVKKDEEEEKIKKQIEENEKAENKEEKAKFLLEYYDLPYRYNETVVKILAQTPKRLFVYWDISDKDRQAYVNAFGEDFFDNTYPVLLVHNEDKNYTREIAINDFANSWYLDINDPRDKYIIQLARKFKENIKPQINEEKNISLNNGYLFIAVSNKLEVPNDHILFEEFKPQIKYKNIKTNQEEIKNVSKNVNKTGLKGLYNKLYDGQIEDSEYDMLNPTSIMGTSSSIARK